MLEVANSTCPIITATGIAPLIVIGIRRIVVGNYLGFLGFRVYIGI